MNNYDIIIVGAGPAGLTAAIYAARASKKVLVLEAKSYGGQIIEALDIENYPAAMHINGFDLATNMYNQAKELNAEIKFEKVVEVTSDLNVITNKDTYKAGAIILATGSDHRKLDLPNEKELTGKGVSYCATCDGNFYRGKDVAVVGGGNSALEEALYLSNICNQVYLIHRRDTFKGDQKSVDQVNEKANIKTILNANVAKINGTDRLESIELNNGEVLNISGLFIAVGLIPENENFAKLINLNEFGYVIANEDCTTNVPGIFVAGDCRTKELRQLVTATSDGAVAAVSAIKYMGIGDE